MTETTRPYRIAFLTKDAPFHNQLLTSLYERLKNAPLAIESSKYKIQTGNSWRQATEAMAMILDQEPDLVVTVGALCSQMARLCMDDVEADIPLLFSAVTMPSLLGLEPTPEEPHETSGVSLGFVSHTQVASLLLFLKPNLKSLLLPFSPSVEAGELANAAQLITEYLGKRGVTVHAVPITSTSKFFDLINPHLNHVDTLMTLEGCHSNHLDDEIIKICNNRAITFFCGGSIENVRKGAAAGLVPNPTSISEPLYEYIYEVAVNKTKPSDLPIKFLKNKGRQVSLNLEAASKQGLHISPVLEYFFRYGKVTGDLKSIEEIEKQ